MGVRLWLGLVVVGAIILIEGALVVSFARGMSRLGQSGRRNLMHWVLITLPASLGWALISGVCAMLFHEWWVYFPVSGVALLLAMPVMRRTGQRLGIAKDR